jgi:hypothetical protein
MHVVAVVCGAQVVLSSLVKALPGIGNVAMLVVVFWLIFAILGVNLFGGKFHTCTDGSVDNKVCVCRSGRCSSSIVLFVDAS